MGQIEVHNMDFISRLLIKRTFESKVLSKKMSTKVPTQRFDLRKSVENRETLVEPLPKLLAQKRLLEALKCLKLRVNSCKPKKVF